MTLDNPVRNVLLFALKWLRGSRSSSSSRSPRSSASLDVPSLVTALPRTSNWCFRVEGATHPNTPRHTALHRPGQKFPVRDGLGLVHSLHSSLAGPIRGGETAALRSPAVSCDLAVAPGFSFRFRGQHNPVCCIFGRIVTKPQYLAATYPGFPCHISRMILCCRHDSEC